MLRIVLWTCLVISASLSHTVVKTHHPHRKHHRLCEDCTNTSTPILYEVSARRPVYVLFPVPTSYNKVLNPFDIVMDLVEPVIDIALEDVYKRKLLEPGSIKIIVEDSKMSDAHGPNVAIKQLVSNKLDCIIG